MRGTRVVRFWAKANLPNENGCMLWTASTQTNGYGSFGIWLGDRTRVVRAHRFAYEWAFGPIPDGLVIDHLCRVRACVRPDHLEAVTTAVNNSRGSREHQGAWQRLRTHCPSGHPYDDANTIRRYGKRHCRACARRAGRDYRRRLRASMKGNP